MEQPQFPKLIAAVFTDSENGRVNLTLNGREAGHELNDNSPVDDGYRYHDALHLAHAAITGWSPVTRWLLGLPNPKEARGHGGSIQTEEAMAAVIFGSHRSASEHGLPWPGDMELQAIMDMARRAGAPELPPETWARAMEEGIKVMSTLRENGGGQVALDTELGKIAALTDTGETPLDITVTQSSQSAYAA